jgi:hypothetical protein
VSSQTQPTAPHEKIINLKGNIIQFSIQVDGHQSYLQDEFCKIISIKLSLTRGLYFVNNNPLL